ncbi:MAG: hypothetical protein WDN72_02645 [Alphaproteobacteria bacterium]
MTLKSVRKGKKNPAPDPYLIAQLLWKEEALDVLEKYGLAKGWRTQRVKLIHERLATELSFKNLATEVRSTLKQRNSWLRQDGAHQLNVPVHA